jgi:hypothetical protein
LSKKEKKNWKWNYKIKMKWFFEILFPKLEILINIDRFLIFGSSMSVNNNIESFKKKKKTFISHLWPNLMTSSYGWMMATLAASQNWTRGCVTTLWPCHLH